MSILKTILSSDYRKKYLLKNTAIFTIGNIGSKIISFFLIPLYTYTLSAAEYGTIDLIITIGTIAVPILTLNISESVLRFNLDKDADKDIITKIGLFFLLICLTGSLALLPVLRAFEKTRELSCYIILYVILSAISQLFLCDLKGKEKLLSYSIGNIFNALLVAGLNILFLVVYKSGIRGYLTAYIIANAFTSAFAIVAGKGYEAITTKIDKQKMLEMVKYSALLVPNSLMWWIMNSSDHLMVTEMIGIEANGIYAVSYKIPTLITTFTIIFNQAWSYSAIREKNAVDEAEYNNKVFKSLICVSMTIGIIMMAVVKPFLMVYVAPEYFESWKYTPFLIAGCVYLTLATFMSTSYTVNKDSFGFLISASLGAITNILLNFLLIPKTGVYGAAFATCISYLTVFLFRLFHTRKYIKYKCATIEFIIGTIFLTSSGLLMFKSGVVAQVIQLILCFAFLLIVAIDFLLKKGYRNE